eukprot:comp9083_c0_seq1/m.4258 comp9083_c0_seq1/g.4258  ORF comp9083_c0_seq1/g.4258 comp9083_c0_seq1/m.4258 type:complete len:283 (-) comp9083_c0_seq1:358-1206(-)
MASRVLSVVVAASIATTALSASLPVEDSQVVDTTTNENAEAVVSVERRSGWTKFPQGTKWSNLAWEFKSDNVRSADVVDVDAFDADESEISGHKRKGRAVICYMSAGTLERWRPDADDAPSSALANKYHGKGAETWFDIKEWQKLKPFINNRLSMAADKGCDAIEFDNIDCYSNDCTSGGRSALRNDQVDFARWLADAAHSRGMAAGFKNAVDLISQLVSKFDFAINESCTRFNECRYYSAFKSADKAVFGVEYSAKGEACSQADKYGISMKVANGGSWKTC